MKNSKEFQELLDKLSAYTYGILYNDGKFIIDQDEIARRDGTDIIVQTPEMVDQHKSGMCHDATLYVDKALNVFEIPHKCVYVASHVKPELKTHSFVLVNDEDSQDWIIVDVFASKNCICPAGSFKYWNDAVDARIASWIKDDNRNSANLSVFVLDHMPEGNKGFVEYSQEIVSSAEEYEFNYGYSHLEYENTGIYQALKEAAGWDWKDIIKSENISWLPKPPEYNGSYESYFTMKGYRKFQEKVMPVIEKYLDTTKIIEKYIDEIEQDSIVYSDEFQVIIKKKFDSFNRLFEEVMNKIKNTTIDCDAFLAVEETEPNPIWFKQYFGQKPDERFIKFKEEILGKTKLNKSYVDAALNRFIAYIINPVEHDSSIKSCLNAFQREYERSKSKIDRNEWLNMKLSTLDNNFIEVFDEYFPKDKRTINSYEEMMKHKFMFVILIYKIMNCLGYNMDEKLKNHFKIFRYRDV